MCLDREMLCFSCFKQLNNVLIDDQNRPLLMDFGSVAEARKKIRSRQDAIRLEEWAAENCTR
jgi:serine/threonine kinase 16